MTPKNAIILMHELMNLAEGMDPEAITFELEDIQDKLMTFCPPSVTIPELKHAYELLAKAKLSFRNKML